MLEGVNMIREITKNELPACLEVIHKSFATVAEDFGFTRENCPTHTSFMELGKLQEEYDSGRIFGYFQNGLLIGLFVLSKREESAYKLKHLAVLPEYRHNGYGKTLLEYAKLKVKELGGNKLELGMINESTILKSWYIASGFRVTDLQKYDKLPFTVWDATYNDLSYR